MLGCAEMSKRSLQTPGILSSNRAPKICSLIIVIQGRRRKKKQP